jgi:DNA/RNA endonuclease G (NUC1)
MDASGQTKRDVIIIYNEGFYKSYFSLKLKQPLYVVADTVYKGGGSCSRASMIFKGIKDTTATANDYKYSGFDIGHLYDAETAAFDCEREKRTFRYYNALPQTHKLNAGIWRKYEDSVRKLSQTKRLKVIAGGIFTSGKFIGDHASVPDYLYKIVFDSKKKVVWCLLFPNDKSGTVQYLTLKQLKKLLGYTLVY